MSEGYFVLPTEEELELAHHGILGQRWGIRRYQNADGSLTPAGLRRYGSKENYLAVKKAKVESEAYAIRNKAKLKAQKQEEKLNKKIRKEKTKEELDTVKELNKIEGKSKQKDYRRDDRFQGQYSDQGYQQGKPSAGVKFLRAAKELGITNMVMDVGASTLKRYAFAKLDEAMLSPTEKMVKEYDRKLKVVVAKNNLTSARIDNKAITDNYKNYSKYAYVDAYNKKMNDMRKSDPTHAYKYQDMHPGDILRDMSGRAMKDENGQLMFNTVTDSRTKYNTWSSLRGGKDYQPDYQRYNDNNRKNNQQKRDNRR